MSNIFARLALAAGVLAALLVGGSGPAYRFLNVDLLTAFEFMKYGVFAAVGAAGLAFMWLVASLISRSFQNVAIVVAGLLLAAGASYFPINLQQMAASVPMIHDITTDTENPPAFQELAAVRAKAPNGVDYKTDPALQKKAYPDIQPFTSTLAAGDLFDRALNVAKGMNWAIASSSREEGRIEATDTTVWFGFKDDVVIRIVAVGEGSRLDIRSMSRVGKSDVGKNAARIRAFLSELKAAK